MKQSEKSFELLEKNFKFNVKWFTINSLVANLGTLATKMDSDTMKELLETYYYGLEQQKITGFTTDILTVTNKKKLYSYLLEKKLISDGKPLEEMIEDSLCDCTISQLLITEYYDVCKVKRYEKKL